MGSRVKKPITSNTNFISPIGRFGNYVGAELIQEWDFSLNSYKVSKCHYVNPQRSTVASNGSKSLLFYLFNYVINFTPPCIDLGSNWCPKHRLNDQMCHVVVNSAQRSFRISKWMRIHSGSCKWHCKGSCHLSRHFMTPQVPKSGTCNFSAT